MEQKTWSDFKALRVRATYRRAALEVRLASLSAHPTCDTQQVSAQFRDYYTKNKVKVQLFHSIHIQDNVS